jgi:hypothetical protein
MHAEGSGNNCKGIVALKDWRGLGTRQCALGFFERAFHNESAQAHPRSGGRSFNTPLFALAEPDGKNLVLPSPGPAGAIDA